MWNGRIYNRALVVLLSGHEGLLALSWCSYRTWRKRSSPFWERSSPAHQRYRAYKSVIHRSPVLQNWIVPSIRPLDHTKSPQQCTDPTVWSNSRDQNRQNQYNCLFLSRTHHLGLFSLTSCWTDTRTESSEELFVEVRTHSSVVELWTPWFHGFPVFLFIYCVFIWKVRLPQCLLGP